uniref:Predicted protein n=1 Tax=Hordeum vulgare subsp. vulgare TaxID=112509 RepID=F2E627_HORVV|nr:predicted protein [Hordeum vulgare subsp. vulgare]
MRRRSGAGSWTGGQGQEAEGCKRTQKKKLLVV